MARDDFSRKTKRVLAERAGYICSFPECNKTTVGPSKTIFSKSIITGIAAHITAASTNGPRFDNTLTSEERKSIDNAIWLCNDHGQIIDKDETSYKCVEIKDWKKNHELKIKYLQEGINSFAGSIIKIKINNFARIRSNCEFLLKKNNIIYGKNGTGKSLIADLISFYNYENCFKRWWEKNNVGISSFKIYFFKNKMDETSINIIDKDNIQVLYNNIIYPNIIPQYHSVYLYKKFKFDYSVLNNLLEEEN